MPVAVPPFIFFSFMNLFLSQFFLLRILYTIIIKYDHICSLFLSSSSLSIPPICLLPNFIPLCSPFLLFFLTMHWVQLVLILCAWVQGYPVDHGKHTNKNTFKWFFLPQAAFNCQWLLNKGWGLESIYAITLAVLLSCRWPQLLWVHDSQPCGVQKAAFHIMSLYSLLLHFSMSPSEMVPES